MRLLIKGGDGDQGYFSQPITLEPVERDWFDRRTPNGRADLFLIVGGIHDGKYIALTSRVKSDLNSQFCIQGFASVIVHVVKRIGQNYTPSLDNLDAIGMAVAEFVEH